MYPKQQRFLVFGLSRSGIASVRFLHKKEASVYMYDEGTSERIEQTIAMLEGLGAKRIAKEEIEKTMEYCDCLVLSPGIPIDHPIAISFKKKGKAVIGETELAVRYMQCLSIAVTGTNGKTTTVSMLADVLSTDDKKAVACGNIGVPMLDIIEDKDVLAVAEISSFQMETLNSFCPHVAVVLNVTQDHLNRHYTMENYIFLKEKLLKNLTETEYAVLNYDDKITKEFAQKTKANVLFFSVKEKVRGAYYSNGELWFGNEKIMDAEQLFAVGLHNVQNALACICVAKIMGISTKHIVEKLSSFRGIKHRIEKIAEIDGVTYIDDSKGTNIDATIKAVEAMKGETILLLGGKNKGYDYKKLFTFLKNSKVIHTVMYGENRFELLKSAFACGFVQFSICDTFEFAVQIARLRSVSGQTVLLSPASASFDAFTSYEERGEKFVEIVHSFERNDREKRDEVEKENLFERDLELEEKEAEE